MKKITITLIALFVGVLMYAQPTGYFHYQDVSPQGATFNLYNVFYLNTGNATDQVFTLNMDGVQAVIKVEQWIEIGEQWWKLNTVYDYPYMNKSLYSTFWTAVATGTNKVKLETDLINYYTDNVYVFE